MRQSKWNKVFNWCGNYGGSRRRGRNCRNFGLHVSKPSKLSQRLKTFKARRRMICTKTWCWTAKKEATPSKQHHSLQRQRYPSQTSLIYNQSNLRPTNENLPPSAKTTTTTTHTSTNDSTSNPPQYFRLLKNWQVFFSIWCPRPRSIAPSIHHTPFPFCAHHIKNKPKKHNLPPNWRY